MTNPTDEELRALLAAATPGPWEWWTSNSFRRLSSNATRKDGDVMYGVAQRDGHGDVVLPNGGWDGPDAKLIAAAPDLAAEVLRLREQVAAQAEREARLVAALRAAFQAVNDSYAEAQAEWQHADKRGDKLNRAVHAWREEARAALAAYEEATR